MARPAKMSRRQLYEEAARAFAVHGYAGASIQQLADAIGVNKSALYYYCPSKEQLLFEISRDAVERTLARVSSAVAGVEAPEMAIRVAVHAHLASLAETRYEHRVLMAELHSLAPEHRAQVISLRDRYEAIWSELLHRGIEAGVLSDVDAKFARLAVLGVLNWVIYWYRPDEGPVDEMAERLAEFILGGLGAAGHPSVAARRTRRRSATTPARRLRGGKRI